MRAASVGRALVATGALGALALSIHAAINLRRVVSPSARPERLSAGRVSVLVPLRDEAHRLEPCVRSLLDQRGVPDLEIVLLDDGSTDGTGDLLREITAGDPRVTILDGPNADPPLGWRGKPWACHRLCLAATGSTLVFVDADVVLEPYALASAVQAMRAGGWDLASAYPRQMADTVAERITQPLVTWYWITTMPLALATSRNHMFTAAIGQFLVVDALAYRASGGHESVAYSVVDDVGLAQSLKHHGFRVTPMDGSQIATCRMYDGAADVWEGYCKSLWSVFGSVPRGLAAVASLTLLYVAPPAAALLARDRATRRWGALGYAAGVAGRAVVAHRTGERMLPDVLAQPASAAAYATLTVASFCRRRWGSLSWKGRRV